MKASRAISDTFTSTEINSLDMTHQYEEQAAISSDINIYLIRTSRWKNLGSKSHILCLIIIIIIIIINFIYVSNKIAVSH